MFLQRVTLLGIQLGKIEALNAVLQLKFTNYRTPFLQAYLYFTAYSVTSTSLVQGVCVKHTSSPVPLIDAYEISVQPIDPLYVSDGIYIEKNASSSTAEFSAFLNNAYSSLEAMVGYEGCTATLPPSPVIPAFVNLSPASATASASTTPAESSAVALPLATEGHVHSTHIIIVSVVVPTAGLMILLLCFIVIRRYRKKRSQAVFTNEPDKTSNTQLYVDQKAELEDEERRRHELDAGGTTYEMEGEDRRFEMPGDGNTQLRLASSNKTQELRGAEHSKELEVPGNI